MKTNSIPPDYKGFRFPPEIISHAVWWSFRFSLSFRGVEELLAQREIVVSYETVRQWCGARLGKRTPMSCGVAVLGVGTNGIWTRCFSRSVAKDSICGER
jgi:hypothetical protein